MHRLVCGPRDKKNRGLGGQGQTMFTTGLSGAIWDLDLGFALGLMLQDVVG
jgi:hypothetical protein